MNNDTLFRVNVQEQEDQKRKKTYQECHNEQFKILHEESQVLFEEKSKLGYSDLTWDQFLKLDTDDLGQAEASGIIVLQKRYSSYQERESDFNNTICIEPSKLPDAVDAAERLLAEKDYDIYQRSGALVRVAKVRSLPRNKMAIKSRARDAVIIKELDQAFLTVFLTKIGKFIVFDSRSGTTRKIDCPERIARYLIAKQQWKLPILTGIINAPTLRSDGSILDNPGYDPESGLLFISDGNAWGKCIENPSYDDAQQAKNELLFLLEGFPFENEASRSVALAAILTVLIRKSLATAPLVGFSAPKMSSGKSLLADVISLIGTGKVNSVIAQADSEAEEKKRILSILMEGDPVICYDNIEKPFGSAALCAILTQCEYKDRVLGASETKTVLTNATFLATGNNLTFAGDISTRTLLCKIDAQVEYPEERDFKLDLRIYIPANRERLVQAALTILRAYHVAGRPPQNIKQYGRFEEWSGWIRSAIVWLGLADPCETRKDIQDADPVRVLLQALFASWHAVIGEKPVKVKEILATAMGNLNDEKNDQQDTLREALLDIASDNKGGINQRVLAKKLSAYKNRIEAGLRLEREGTHQGTTLWRIKKVS